MKKLLTITMLFLLLVACKEENSALSKIKEATNQVKEAKQGLNNLDNIIDGAEDLQKNIEKLSEITPVSKEQIKAWMPEKLGDLKRTEYNIGSQIGISVFKLSFKGDNDKKINVTISDGAGKGSALVAMFSMFQNMEIDTENESGYERTQTFDGQRTLIKYQASSNYQKTTLQYLVNQRFGIEANAWKMEPDELWEHLAALNIESLIEE
ncbi:hypothetical protein [Psychroserpens jangbogonensis]|uniref:hypothetical protein n=1 Tax=Psychroserpens jangbogonensis TaxID=1484460 RepID=UPI00053D76F1|nr:hypothetical protein [Psychroserpens jangbogonensis]